MRPQFTLDRNVDVFAGVLRLFFAELEKLLVLLGILLQKLTATAASDIAELFDGEINRDLTTRVAS